MPAGRLLRIGAWIALPTSALLLIVPGPGRAVAAVVLAGVAIAGAVRGVRARRSPAGCGCQAAAGTSATIAGRRPPPSARTIGRRRFLRRATELVVAGAAGMVVGGWRPGAVARARPPGGLVITGRAVGPGQAQVDAAVSTMLRSRTAARAVGTRSFELARRLVDDGVSATQRVQAVVHDYDEHRTLVLDAPLATAGHVRIGEAPAGVPAPPSDDEYAAALDVVRRRAPHLLPPGARSYRAMPASTVRHVDGRVHRVVPVGLAWRTADAVRQRVVGVDLSTDEVLDDLDTLVAEVEADCGVADDDTCERTEATVGQAHIQISDGDRVLWDLIAVRPAASSGRAASGLEVLDLRYRGRLVLRRAHTPIINVQYAPNPLGCGPSYRDWGGEESCFEASGADVAPGIRICDAPPRTILDGARRDGGTFRGVAVFTDGPVTTLVSELRAGWYRYVSELHLHADGTIMPRFGFAAVQNPCTCSDHTHHAYWRLDFDPGGSGRQRVEEVDRHRSVTLLRHETRRQRAPWRRWRVRGVGVDGGYELWPGRHDGVADAFGVGDLWVLRAHPDELDDGAIGRSDAAAVDELTVPAESVVDTDVVVWYAVHRPHVPGETHGERLGPTLRPLGRGPTPA